MSGQTGTDPSLEAAADATLAKLRELRDQALAANGLSDFALQSVIDSGSGWFTTEGKVSIAKNLQKDAEYIDNLAGKYRQWAEAGQRDDGTPYDWSRWADFANNTVASDLSLNASLAWDASVTGPLLNAAGATVSSIGSGVSDAVQALGNAELSLLGPLASKWFWLALAGGAALYFAWPFIGKVKEGLAKVAP